MSDSNQQHEGERGNVVDQVADLLMKDEPSVEESPEAEKVHRPNDDDLVDDSEESEGVEAQEYDDEDDDLDTDYSNEHETEDDDDSSYLNELEARRSGTQLIDMLRVLGDSAEGQARLFGFIATPPPPPRRSAVVEGAVAIPQATTGC